MAPLSLIPSDAAQSLDLAHSIQVSAAGIVSRTVIQTPEIKTTLFAFDSGQELTPHTSRRRALIHVLNGSVEFFYAEAWHRLEVGTLLHLPPNHLHAVKASYGPFTMLLTLIADTPPSTRTS